MPGRWSRACSSGRSREAMSLTVWLGVDTASFPEGGGNLWAHLSWALGLRSLGCRVVWLEPSEPDALEAEVEALVRGLKERLQPFGLADQIAVCPRSDGDPSRGDREGCVPLEAAREADLLLNLAYDGHESLVPHFRRTVVVDLDPELLHDWIGAGVLALPRYDAYFTTGEAVGQRNSSDGLPWLYTPECVALDWWPVCTAPEDAPFTTVSSWDADDWFYDGTTWQLSSKRGGFLPFLDLPRHTSQRLELALQLWEHPEADRLELERRGWRVVHAYDVSATPHDYQRYIQASRGEFTWAKPCCATSENAWISDRTLCYLASGKPAVVEYTGPSRILPDDAGLFRFRTLEEAARHLETVAADYEHQCRLARALVEEHFDARKVLASILERAL
jgi:hypothetical protein